MKVYRTYIYIYISLCEQTGTCPHLQLKTLRKNLPLHEQLQELICVYDSTIPRYPTSPSVPPPLSKDGIGRFLSGKNEAQPKIGTFRVGQCLTDPPKTADRRMEDSDGGVHPSKFRAIGFINIDNHPFHFLG